MSGGAGGGGGDGDGERALGGFVERGLADEAGFVDAADDGGGGRPDGVAAAAGGAAGASWSCGDGE